MKEIIVFLTLVIGYCPNIFSQNIITGVVVDAESRQPLHYAVIAEFSNIANKTVTNSSGAFSIKSSNKIIISSIGYQSDTITVNNNSNNIIGLNSQAINLKDIVLESKTLNKFSTISKIDLNLKPVKNTQELLRLVPGLFIAQHAGGGKAEQIFLRGFDVDHGTDVQVSVDGMPVNMVSHAHGQGYADAHFIIPETINNIDFGAGPYYAEQGNLNTAGYVSFSTYKNINKNTVQIEGGRFNSFRALTMIDLLKKNKDNQSAYIATDYNYTDGPTIAPQKFNRFNILGKYNISITANTQVSLSLSSFTSKWNASGQIPTRAVESGLITRFGSIDPTEGGNTERHNANVVMKNNLKSGANVETQFYYSKYAFSLNSNFTFFLNDSINGDAINQSENRNVFGYSSKLSNKYFFKKVSLNSIYGIGIRHDATTDSRLSKIKQRQFISDVKRGDIKETNASAYTQQELVKGNWLFNGGARVDFFNFSYFDKLNIQQLPSQQKAIFSPKLNIQYTVNKKVQLFIKTGKGFHSNDTRVVVANDGKEILPAAYGSDIGVILKPNDKVLINFAAWYLYLNQEFVYVGDDGNVEPSGKSRREGIDITTRYQISKKLFANANFNFTKPRAIEEPKGANYIPLAPTFTSVGGLYYKAQKGINGSISYRYIKDRPANEDNSIVAKGYFILDASINYTQPKYEFGLSVENLLNTEWNEAQFATESRLLNETAPVTELNFTPGAPFFARLKFAVFF